MDNIARRGLDMCTYLLMRYVSKRRDGANEVLRSELEGFLFSFNKGENDESLYIIRDIMLEELNEGMYLHDMTLGEYKKKFIQVVRDAAGGGSPAIKFFESVFRDFERLGETIEEPEDY